MIIKRVDEANFQRRPWGVLEEYLTDKELGKGRRDFVDSLRADECLALVSKNGHSVVFVRGFDNVETEDGTIRKALGFYQVQLDHKWNLTMLQTYVKEGRLPFRVQNYKSFEDIFTKAAKAGKVFVRKAA